MTFAWINSYFFCLLIVNKVVVKFRYVEYGHAEYVLSKH